MHLNQAVADPADRIGDNPLHLYLMVDGVGFMSGTEVEDSAQPSPETAPPTASTFCFGK